MTTQADIDALNAAIASSVRQVSIGGQSVTYQTVASLIEARNDARRELTRAASAAKPKQTYIYYER
jgi:hypothetical protein